MLNETTWALVMGLEPATSSLRVRHVTHCTTTPFIRIHVLIKFVYNWTSLNIFEIIIIKLEAQAMACDGEFTCCIKNITFYYFDRNTSNTIIRCHIYCMLPQLSPDHKHSWCTIKHTINTLVINIWSKLYSLLIVVYLV